MRRPRFLALVPRLEPMQRPEWVSPGFELKTKVFVVALLVPSELAKNLGGRIGIA